MEEWLRKIIEECKSKSQKSLEEMKEQPLRMSMSFEAGKESFGFDIDLRDLAESLLLPAHLLGRAFDGIKNTVEGLGIPIKKDYRIKGYSESEYVIPYYLETKESQILFDPLYFSGFMEAFGLGQLEYSVFSPILALEFFKYIDILNAQTKPTIMAFIGLNGFRDITEVNFLDFLKEQLKNYNITPKKEDIQKSMKEKYIYEINPQNMFKAYGIPKFQMQVIDALRLSLYDPKKLSEKKKINAYATSLGIYGFLNPTLVDYPLFVTHLSGKTKPEVVRDVMRKGKALGHSPSKSELLPDLEPKEALDDPLILMKELKKLNMVTEFRGTYNLANKGLHMINAEIMGKPKEWSLSKIWKLMKKAKEILPFLRFLSKK